MIKINKSANIPAALSVSAPTCSNDIDDKIYRDQLVRKVLREDQHNKCAYCERYFNGDYGAVEHYRPKKKYKIACGCPEHDGYYWLAYNWHNLLYSCSECNTTYKRTLFPLWDESKRNIEGKDITKEKPLIINPANDDPSIIIGWHKEFAIPISQDPYLKKKADTTISIFALNDRADLVGRRQITYKAYLKSKAQYLFLCRTKAPKELIDLSKSLLDEYISEDAEFLGMLTNQI